VDENTNVDVFENMRNITQDHLNMQSFKVQVNVLDEVPQSYPYQRNPELDQIRHTTKMTRSQVLS